MPPSTQFERLLEQTYQAERRHFWFRGFRRFVQPLLTRAAAGRQDLRLLDCGCGTGANLTLLDHFGTSFGFDLSEAGPRFAVSHYRRQRLARANTLHLPFPDGAFDLVTSFDVLYCLPEGADALAVAEFHRVLRPGGSVIVNVAAMKVLRGDHSVAAAEVQRYDRAAMAALLTQAGFAIDRLTYTNATLFPLVLAQRLWQRARGLPAAEAAANQLAVPAAPVNAVLTAVLMLEGLLLEHVDMPFGSSLLVLAHRT
jgi:SAM-dependent methyltransferase